MEKYHDLVGWAWTLLPLEPDLRAELLKVWKDVLPAERPEYLLKWKQSESWIYEG